MMVEVKAFAFDLEEPESLAESGEFSGYAAVFGNVDSCGDIILPGAFSKDLDWFLENGAICWQHDWNTPIGRPIEAREDTKGLFVRGSLVDTTAGEDARKLMLAGIVRKLSIGFSPLEEERITPANLPSFLGGDVDPDDSLNAMKWGRALKRIKVFDVSPVTIPANELAAISAVKGNLPVGYKLGDHSEAVRDAVDDFTGRVRALVEIRLKEGRELSTENHSRLTAVHAGIHACANDLADLIEKCKPKSKTADKDVIDAITSEFKRQSLGLLAIQIGDLKK